MGWWVSFLKPRPFLPCLYTLLVCSPCICHSSASTVPSLLTKPCKIVPSTTLTASWIWPADLSFGGSAPSFPNLCRRIRYAIIFFWSWLFLSRCHCISASASTGFMDMLRIVARISARSMGGAEDILWTNVFHTLSCFVLQVQQQREPLQLLLQVSEQKMNPFSGLGPLSISMP